VVESFIADVPEPEEGSEEQLDPVPLMDRSCVANVLEKVHYFCFSFLLLQIFFRNRVIFFRNRVPAFCVIFCHHWALGGGGASAPQLPRVTRSLVFRQERVFRVFLVRFRLDFTFPGQAVKLMREKILNTCPNIAIFRF